MRRMSFTMTKRQLLDGTKTVTRRTGWRSLKAGDTVLAVSKVMGMRKGETAQIYGTCEILDVRREPLDWITDADVAAEGFPSMTRWASHASAPRTGSGVSSSSVVASCTRNKPSWWARDPSVARALATPWRWTPIA